MYISESSLSLEISLKCRKLDGKLTPIIIVWFAQAGKCSGLFCHIFFSLCVFAGICLSLILIMIVLVHVCSGFPLQFYSIGVMIGVMIDG